MDRSHLAKQPSNIPPGNPKQVEIREIEPLKMVIQNQVRTLTLVLQLVEKTPQGEKPFAHQELVIKVDQQKRAQVITDESGLIDQSVAIGKVEGTNLMMTVPGTVAFIRKKLSEITTRDMDEEQEKVERERREREEKRKADEEMGRKRKELENMQRLADEAYEKELIAHLEKELEKMRPVLVRFDSHLETLSRILEVLRIRDNHSLPFNERIWAAASLDAYRQILFSIFGTVNISSKDFEIYYDFTRKLSQHVGQAFHGIQFLLRCCESNFAAVNLDVWRKKLEEAKQKKFSIKIHPGNTLIDELSSSFAQFNPFEGVKRRGFI